MVEKVDSRPRTGDGQWQSQSDLFGGSHYQPPPSPETTTLTLPTFTENDLCYLGHLLIYGPSLMMLESFRVPLEPQIRDDITSYLQEFKEVDLEDYFDSKREMPKIDKKLQQFADLPMEARQAVLTSNPNATLILEPLSQLATEDLKFWHHIIHNDCALRYPY